MQKWKEGDFGMNRYHHRQSNGDDDACASERVLAEPLWQIHIYRVYKRLVQPVKNQNNLMKKEVRSWVS